MNKNRIALTAVLLLAGICTFASENYKADFSKKGWASWKAKDAVSICSLDKTIGRTAPGSLKITVGPDCPVNRSTCFLHRLPITPGKNYTASIWYKTAGTDPEVKVSLSFQGLGEKAKFLNNGVYGTKKSAAGEWTRLVYSIRIPAKGKKWEQAKMLLCTLSVSQTAKGEVWFDDFEFQCDDDEDE